MSARKPAIDLLIRNIGQIATPAGSSSRRGKEMDSLRTVGQGAIAVRDGRIVAAGEERKVLSLLEGGAAPVEELDAGRRLATPALCDPHTHVVFAGHRALEFDLRIRGTSYQEIARQGGGILHSVRSAREASLETLCAESEGRLRRMLACGTTLVEAKSGYGLDTATEIKLLEAVRELSARVPIELVPTFLGAHEIPPEYRADPEAYVRLVIEDMVPEVARRGLAEYVDVFCEAGVFTVDQARRILQAGQAAGLKPRIHADEFDRIGGALLAAEIGCASADHLLVADASGISALARSGVTAVLLPGTSLGLGLRKFADARAMIAEGVPVAIGTDCNPGSGYLESMPLVMSLACCLLRMTPAEALTAATLNAACSLGRGDRLGSLEPGKSADWVLWDAGDYRELPYRCGTPLAWRVYRMGEEVAREGKPFEGAVGRRRGTRRPVGAPGEAIAYVDGASRNNPGLAGAGVYLSGPGGELLAEVGQYLGVMSNNQAEYRALLLALEKASELGIRRLKVRSDSQLMVRQMEGTYKIKDPGLQALAARARELAGRFEALAFEHIPREQNREADRLANQGIDRR